MGLDISAELWSELKNFILPTDRADAADTVVTMLIDAGFDADEIREAFKSDSDIKLAIADYIGDDEIDDDFLDDDDELDFDE